MISLTQWVYVSPVTSHFADVDTEQMTGVPGVPGIPLKLETHKHTEKTKVGIESIVHIIWLHVWFCIDVN